MRLHIKQQNGVYWLMTEDNKSLTYFDTYEEMDDLRASLAFACMDMEQSDVDYSFETAPTRYEKHEGES